MRIFFLLPVYAAPGFFGRKGFSTEEMAETEREMNRQPSTSSYTSFISPPPVAPPTPVIGNFRGLMNDTTLVDFFIIGDWGKKSESVERIAKSMQTLSAKKKPDFVLYSVS
jgi:hypothetical protein